MILMGSFIFQRRTTLSLYENGFVLKKSRVNWEDIEAIDKDGLVKVKDRQTINIPKNLQDYDYIIDSIRQKVL